MACFSSGAVTLFVEPDDISFVEYTGPSASMGEGGGSLGTVDDLLADARLQEWTRNKLGEENLQGALAEARRIVAARPKTPA